MVKAIDGPALMKLREADLLDWKLKQADIQLILRKCSDLKRLDAGQVGWSPGAFAPEITLPSRKPVRQRGLTRAAPTPIIARSLVPCTHASLDVPCLPHRTTLVA